MIIKDMFAKPIDRDIKGVIKVGQGDDINVGQELGEYVVTRELQKHFDRFFSSYKKGITGNTDKMGVWISGFFGSGKSHFLKILSYILSDKRVDGKRAIEYFIDDEKIKDNMVLANMKLAAATSTDAILFNIDSKGETSGKQSKNAIVFVFLNVFNDMQGLCGSMPFLADLERKLVEEGKYDEFKSKFESSFGSPWEEARNDFDFIQDDVVDVLSSIDFMSIEAARNWCEKSIEPYSISIENFAKLVKKYIDKKGNNHHVVFLVDEIGQYIGEDSQLMLNLQTITEELGTACGGKAWVIVTSQQDIDSITKTKGNDFSKISGRFDTRLSLSSANVDEVIRKRILKKNSTAEQTLGLLYDEKSTIIKNLIVFNGAEKKLYSDRNDFAAVYPFVPYQFNILGNVLTSIRTHGASGKHLADGERSMLALFKESAVKIMSDEQGTLVPFNMFYDALDEFIDHSHKSVILHAKENEYLNPTNQEECFDVNVLKTLFMIKYVEPMIANVENITSLMVSSIDTDRIELTKNVENALKRLVRQTLVQKNGDVYVFLTNEEQEINREIKAQNVETAEVINKVSELIFDGIYEEKKYKYPAFNGRYAFGFNQFVDDRPYRNNQGFDINLKFLMPGFMGTDENMLRMMSGQGHSVIVVLPEDFAFRDEITDALKIEKYLRRNITNTLAKYKQVKDSKKSEMSVHNSNAKLFLEDALKLAEIYVNGDKSKFVSKNISARITDAIGQLVTTVFHKLYYIDTPMGEANIRQLLKGSNQPKFKLESEQICNKLALSDAADFINDNTARHTKTSMKSIIERFTKAPYGFIEDDVQWLIAKLFKDGDIALFVNNESISLLSKSEDEILRYLSKHEFADKLLIETRERPTDRQKKAVREVMKELFNSKPTSDDDDAIMNSFHQYCSNLKTDLEKIEIRQNNQIKYPGRLVISKGKSLLINVLDIKYSTEFFMEIDAKRDEYLDFAEGYQPLKAFFGGEQIAIFDKAINLMNIYDDSKTFIVNEEIEKVVSDIKDIMKKSSPYSEIFKMPELLDKFTGLYRIMLDEMEEPVISSINEAKTRVFAELGQKQCHDILKNSFIRRFEEINDKAAKCNNVATLQNIKIEADALKVRLLNEIASEENKILAAKAKIDEQNKPKNIPGQAVSPTVSVPKVKKQKTISIKQINLETTWQIETEQDIDHYVTELKTRLRKALEDDTVINIEF